MVANYSDLPFFIPPFGTSNPSLSVKVPGGQQKKGQTFPLHVSQVQVKEIHPFSLHNLSYACHKYSTVAPRPPCRLARSASFIALPSIHPSIHPFHHASYIYPSPDPCPYNTQKSHPTAACKSYPPLMSRSCLPTRLSATALLASRHFGQTDGFDHLPRSSCIYIVDRENGIPPYLTAQSTRLVLCPFYSNHNHKTRHDDHERITTISCNRLVHFQQRVRAAPSCTRQH